MATTTQVRLIGPHFAKHRMGSFDVAFLAAMRGAHQGKVRIIEAELAKCTGFNHRQRLSRLCR
ncbi:hypothetical protein D3C81_2174480 [compost metagenome]